jgi:hypothetical protein
MITPVRVSKKPRAVQAMSAQEAVWRRHGFLWGVCGRSLLPRRQGTDSLPELTERLEATAPHAFGRRIPPSKNGPR